MLTLNSYVLSPQLMLGMWLDTTLQPPRLSDILNTARGALRYVLPFSEIYTTSSSTENLEEGGTGDNEARAFRLRRGKYLQPCPPPCPQMARKSVPFLNMDVWSKELLWAITKSGRTQQEHSPDKVAPPPHYSQSPQPVHHTGPWALSWDKQGP